MTNLKHDLAQKTAQVKSIYAQRDDRVKAIAELECVVKDLEDDQDDATQSRQLVVRNLADVENQIAEREKELKEIIPKLAAVKQTEQKAKELCSWWIEHG